MDYSKFYTPPTVAQLLINELEDCAPKKIVDICCGSCNLLNAAKVRWPETELFGIDIDSHPATGVNFLKMDGREYALKHMSQFSLVVANPPFDYLQTPREFPELFQGVFLKFCASRLEVEMLIANLLMLKKSGVLLIIVPSSLVEASSYSKLRKLLAQNYFISKIIKLDEETFGATHINSYALIINNCTMPQYLTKEYAAKKDGGSYSISLVRNIPHSKMESGNWAGDKVKSLKKHLDIRRGTISSAMFLDGGRAVLHTAKYSERWRPSVRYISETVEAHVFAEKGDILVSRIGKSAGQWCLYDGDKMPISDCLYRIKDPNRIVYEKIKGRKFNFPLKGVATRYITMDDFATWIEKGNG